MDSPKFNISRKQVMHRSFLPFPNVCKFWFCKYINRLIYLHDIIIHIYKVVIGWASPADSLVPLSSGRGGSRGRPPQEGGPVLLAGGFNFHFKIEMNIFVLLIWATRPCWLVSLVPVWD